MLLAVYLDPRFKDFAFVHEPVARERMLTDAKRLALTKMREMLGNIPPSFDLFGAPKHDRMDVEQERELGEIMKA
jgi:hypothetical protein